MCHKKNAEGNTQKEKLHESSIFLLRHIVDLSINTSEIYATVSDTYITHFHIKHLPVTPWVVMKYRWIFEQFLVFFLYFLEYRKKIPKNYENITGIS